MTWTYRREERATWDDISRMVRDAVTMQNAIDAYCPEYEPRNHRIPCPIHHGKDYNFSYTRTHFKCFVCNESGDVIDFVRHVCDLRARTDAMKRINADFRLNLPLDREVSGIESVEIQRRRRAAAEREAEEKRLYTAYYAALDKYTAMDLIKQELAPKAPEEEMNPAYVYCCRNIDGAWQEVQEALDAIHKFERKEGDPKLK